MKDTKLIVGLKSLSNKELHRFQYYVQSPFFNQNELSAKLLSALMEYAPTFTDIKPKEDQLSQFFFPKTPAQKKRFREEFSKLFKLLKGYLAYIEFQKQPYKEDLYALEQFRERKLNKAFQTQYLALTKKLNEANQIAVDYYHTRAELSLKANAFYGQKQVRVFDKNLQERANNLDIFYLIIKLRESCEMLNRKHVMNASYQLNLLPEITPLLSKGLPKELRVPAVQIYYQIFLTLTEVEDESHYTKLVQLLDEFHHIFIHEEVRGMYKYAQNYCIRQINGGNLQYLQELFGLYEAQLENKRIFIEGEISHTDYKNIATVGLRIGNYEWVRTFLQEYQDSITPAFRMNVYNYCLASLYFEQGQYGYAIRLLNQVKFTDLQYRVSSHYILLKAYYEMEEWDSLEYMIKAFLNFLQRNKGITPTNRNHHKNFLTILKELIRLQIRKDVLQKHEITPKLVDIQSRLAENPRVPHIQWLTEKSQEFHADEA